MSGIYKTYALTFDGTPSDYIYGDHHGTLITKGEYLLNGEKVEPTEGEVILQWSYDGVTWEEFTGGVYKLPDGCSSACVNSAIRYVRALGSVTGADQISLELRLDNDGFAGIPQTSQSSNPYFSVVNTVQIDGFQQSVLQGNALASSTKITVPANSAYSVKLIKNTNSVVAYVYADGLSISFVDGGASGNLVQLAGGGRLNTLEDFQFQAALEFYDGPATGERLVARVNEITAIPFIVNGGGVVELINTTNSDVATYFSIGQVGLAAPDLDYMLYPGLQLDANTEMSTYNG